MDKNFFFVFKKQRQSKTKLQKFTVIEFFNNNRTYSFAILDKTNDVINTTHDQLNENSNKTDELKEDALAAGQVAEEKVNETAQNVQGKFIWLSILFLWMIYFSYKKASELAADTKETVVAGKNLVEEKLEAAKESVLGESMNGLNICLIV